MQTEVCAKIDAKKMFSHLICSKGFCVHLKSEFNTFNTTSFIFDISTVQLKRIII